MLVCKGLTKRYGKNPNALESIDFSIPSKGIFALIGRNGAGKTTLARILATELIPSSGSASIDGMDVVADAARLREQIAILPQEARAIPWLTSKQSIVSYLLYRGFSLGESEERAQSALARLDLQDYENKLTRILSGGLKRKVLVATILAADSRIVFVDEPTTGLDPISRADLWKVLEELKKEHFVFLTTHYLEEAEKLADVIGILDSGKLLGLGSLAELRKQAGYQYSIRTQQEDVKTKEGIAIRGLDGSVQILTTEEEAGRLAEKLVKDKARFSINPTSLEDIFYYLVKKPIEEENYEEE